MKNDVLISVIVPIYKVEEYLPACINSIISQTYKNLEIILVNDGSPDNCGEICEQYAKNDTRVVVLHKENGGLSDARNAGLDIAKGEFIVFVDSDDLVHEKFIEILYYNIGDSKLAFCNYSEFVKKYDSAIELNNLDVITFDKEFMLENINRFRNPLIVVAWNKIYHKSIWKTLRYPKGKIHEDEFVIHHILDQCAEVNFIDIPLYFYRQREGSIMNDKSIFFSSRNDIIQSKIERKKFFEMNGFSKTVIDSIEKDIDDVYLHVLLTIGYKQTPKEYIKYLNENYYRLKKRQKIKFFVFRFKIAELYKKYLKCKLQKIGLTKNIKK